MKKILVWALLCLIWGSTWLFIKVGLQGLNPITFSSLRFLLASTILGLVILFARISLPRGRQELKLIIITGILQFSINYSTVFWGEKYVTSGLAALLQATIPVFGLIAARIYLPQEKITFRKLLGILLGIIGLAVIFLEQLAIDNYAALAGSFAIVVGAFAAAFSSVLVKAKGKPIDPAATLFTQMLIGLIPIVIYSLLFEGLPSFDKFTFPVIFSLLYLSVVGTIGAFWLYYWLLRQVESTKAMMISLVTPFIAVIFGAIFLDEQLNLQSMLGGLLIISSIGLIIFNRTKLNPTNA